MFKKEKIKDLHYSVNGLIPADQLQAAADEILLEYGKKVKMAGFRQGKVPLTILRQKYNASAYGEAIDKLMNQDLNAYVADKKIRLAGAPKADLAGWEIGKDAEYSLEFDILPTLPAIDLEKITVTKKVADLDEQEVETALENIRKSRSTAEKQDEKYQAANGDVAVIDFKGFVGDTAFEGGEAKKHHLILGSGAFIPGFEDQIIGHKIGDKFDVNVKFPADYHAANLAGQDARFAVEIHEIRKHILPELNDELAKTVGQESVDALKQHIRNILTEQYADAAQREMRNELLDVLADKVKLDLPETLVAQEYEMAKSEFDRNHSHCHDEKCEHKWDEKQERKDAERRVKLGLILAEWGTQNQVEVSRDDLQQAIWAEAARYPDPKQVFEFYNKNQNALAMLRGMLFERKALDAMLTHVKTKEKKVKADDLFKQASVR
ncbi:MAG: trigger factor [Alphaproteobacteria bacterium]|nr:trigger factor [Alphaproteobacteria bacterium]MBR5566731.1 trigger factor [Alphaproteobacteria bacterium]